MPHLFQQIRLDSFLSFAPGTAATDLRSLNVIIGPNGAGKSNLLEAFELVRATSTDFANAIRVGGGAEDWLWKGNRKNQLAVALGQPLPATLDVLLSHCPTTGRSLRYRMEFTAVSKRVEILDEAIEEAQPKQDHSDPFFYYRFQRGHPVMSVRDANSIGPGMRRNLTRDSLKPDQSILAQRKDPDLYPEVTWLGQQFALIHSFREWSFGSLSPLRGGTPMSDPTDQLSRNASNLSLVLNEIQFRDGNRLDEILHKFLPRYDRFSIRPSGSSVQFYIHEDGLIGPISAERVSDGTLRFLAMLAALLTPTPPPLLCLEEPELGMHPDALTLLAELLVDASTRMQLVVTTHSDKLLSALNDKIDSVLVCENNGDGSTLQRLDPDRLSFWLQKYTLGEIWRLGEIGGNP